MKNWLHIASGIGAVVLILIGGYVLFREAPVQEAVVDVVKVGWIGHGEHKAIDLAINDLDMEKVDVIFSEVPCVIEDVERAATNLVDQGVVVVISELCSDSYLSASKVFSNDGVVMIQASSDLRDYVDEPMFRTVPHQGQVLAYGIDYLTSKGIDNIGVVGSSDAWATPLNNLISSLFDGEDETLTFVSSVNNQGESTDDDILKSNLEELKEVDPDIVYIVASGAEAFRILTVAKELELDSTYYGIGELYGESELLEEIGDELRVVVAGGGSSGFVEQYRVAYGEDAGIYSAHAYDAMTAVSRVLRDGATTKEDMVSKLKALSFEGASGKIDFTDNGHIPGRFEVHVLKDGEFLKK
jgi:branched-chain amino acid transport system substrate-binding protein